MQPCVRVSTDAKRGIDKRHSGTDNRDIETQRHRDTGTDALSSFLLVSTQSFFLCSNIAYIGSHQSQPSRLVNRAAMVLDSLHRKSGRAAWGCRITVDWLSREEVQSQEEEMPPRVWGVRARW